MFESPNGWNSENRGTPKSSILIGFSIINHPFWGTTVFGNTQIFSLRRLLGVPNTDPHQAFGGFWISREGTFFLAILQT